ncbi:hypothetical protein L228DRAFT_159556 [Xylona heveae TC161]|uniref:Uncharacterized protein n=1 Tax=Xylona heveae (strain CBS 132557 / TC161) TaxID=1328760 RepID=A0A165G5R7_XYLHT|nr:hypothetical protein L228DRAFT_159556 [Xylona heveae TC161]KZF21768.1 hypothetical protein L228DRAFT_159556 [Xylona heveae TC161]
MHKSSATTTRQRPRGNGLIFLGVILPVGFFVDSAWNGGSACRSTCQVRKSLIFFHGSSNPLKMLI